MKKLLTVLVLFWVMFSVGTIIKKNIWPFSVWNISYLIHFYYKTVIDHSCKSAKDTSVTCNHSPGPQAHLEPRMWVPVAVCLGILLSYGPLQPDMCALPYLSAAVGPVIHSQNIRGFTWPCKQGWLAAQDTLECPVNESVREFCAYSAHERNSLHHCCSQLQ